MTQTIINRTVFESWLRTHYKLSEATYPTIISDAFLIFRKNLGITIDELIDGSKNIEDYKIKVETWLINNGKSVGQRHIEYASHMKYLIKYIKDTQAFNSFELSKCNIDKEVFEHWLRSTYKLKEPTYRTIMSTAFFICRYNLGVSLDDLIHQRKSVEDFKIAVQLWLDKNQTNHTSKPSDYLYHLKYLLEYLKVPLKYDATKIKDIMVKSNKKNTNPNISKPSVETVQRYLELWNSLDNYTSQEKALNHLFHDVFPQNKKMDEVLIKIAALNDFYSTNIFNVYAVAKHYVSIDIDNRLKENDMTLVDDLSLIPNIKSRIYSFATKYCSHHKHNDYPIYDSYVDKMLIYFRDTYHFFEFSKEDLKNYLRFKKVIIEFKNFFELHQFSIKEIDKYLWQAGKDNFPNWKKRKIKQKNGDK